MTGVRIEARGLGVRLGGRVVFDRLSFEWTAPGAVAVTGPNGAGKTTLLKVLAGLLTPGRGEVAWHVDGRALERKAARARLGFATPELGLYEDLTAKENLAFFAAARGLAWNDAEGDALLARLGLGGRGADRVGAYSSGMKQRVRLAFALQGRPALLLLDEPGSNLDAAGRTLVREVVTEAARASLVVVATNDPEEAAWTASTYALAA